MIVGPAAHGLQGVTGAEQRRHQTGAAKGQVVALPAPLARIGKSGQGTGPGASGCIRQQLGAFLGREVSEKKAAGRLLHEGWSPPADLLGLTSLPYQWTAIPSLITTFHRPWPAAPRA